MGIRHNLLWITCTLLLGCAANPKAPDPEPLSKGIDPVAETTLAYSQLGVLRYYHTIEKIDAGELDETRSELCAWLAEEIEVLIRFAYEVPAEFHTRTLKILRLISNRSIECRESEQLQPKIQAALKKFESDGT